jgi:putative membrane protein
VISNRKAASIGAVLLFSAACASTQSTGDFTVSTVNSDANIMALLHESNRAEIEAGQTAQQKATNAAVRSFAQMMVTEHTSLDQQGIALAQQLSITPELPDNNLPALHQQEAAALNAAAAGATFDRLYVSQQVTAHRRTLALIDTSIDRAQRAELKTALSNQVRPRVVAHLNAAVALQSTVGGQ